MKAIILSAGLQGISTIKNEGLIPPCLMRVENKTLLEKQIEILKKSGVKDILVVIGNEGECWNKENQEKIRKIAKNVIINQDNAITTSSSSILLGLKFFKPDKCLLIDGDLVFEEAVIKSVISNKNPRLIVVEKTGGYSKCNYVETKGELVKSISRSVKTKKRFIGLTKIDEILFKKMKEILDRSENSKMEYTLLLNKLLTDLSLFYLDIENMDGNIGDLFNFKPLMGGSYANTRTISRLIKKVSYVVRKEASDEGKQKLIDEITWIKKLPIEISNYFPDIISYEINEKKAWYEMEYFDLPTLKNLLLSKTIHEKEGVYIIKSLIKLMFDKFYSRKSNAQTKNYVEEVHLKRIKERISLMSKKSDLMKNVLNSKYIFINGEKFFNLPYILERIGKNKRLLNKLEPPFLCMVHGDLHFDNFLVDISQMPMLKIIFLDPRGLDDKYEYCYDLGKLWHSFHGKYDLIHEGKYKLKYAFKETNFYAKVSFTDEYSYLVYENIYQRIKKFLKKSLKDKNWEIRTEFSEVAHFCSVMPFHIKGDKKEKTAIALYLTAVKLANKFFKEYHIK